jgi:hypothetical protein
MTLAARILVARAQATSRRAGLDRHPDGTTHELRAILARQSMAAQQTRFPAIGRN